MSSSIWWSDKRLKGKFWYEEFAPVLLEIMDKEGTNKIDVKYPHSSIDTYTRAELESDLGIKASKSAIPDKSQPNYYNFTKKGLNSTERVVAHRATTSSFDPKEYEEYLEKHIGNVQKAYEFLVETGIVDFDEQVDELMQQHDQSKYEKVEFNPYGERFYGKFKGSEEDDPNFRYAWLHHQHNNPHHWQYWCLLEDEGKGKVECLDMPEKYIIEMVCDWLAFSIDKNDLGEVEKWYKENKSKQLLSEKTRARVEALLESIKENKELYKPQASIKRVVADKRNIVERRGARQDIPNARDSEFDSGVYEMLRDNPKLMGYIEPWMDVAQVSVIEEALKAGVDVSKLQSPKYNWMQMNAILEYLKEGIDVTKYTKEGRDESIIRQIGEAIKQGMTEAQIKQMLFMKNWMQMREIRLGHKMGINVQSYATKPQMNWQQMRDIRMRLIKEQAHLTASWMPVQAMVIKRDKNGNEED